MGKKVFIFDHNKCNGCYNCQIACKDEHCDNEWLPYAMPQPTTGQFWCKVEEVTHGQVPKVRLSYVPYFGAQNEALREYAPEVLMEREDNLIVLDPEKCKGRKDIAEKFEGVYYNEKLDICQGCTGCAHLVDAGQIPHCVDACTLGALRWGDEADFADEIAQAEQLVEGAPVYYLNLPHLFAAGEVWDPETNEVIIGAKAVLSSGDQTWETETDEFGDFWFRRIDAGDYHLSISADGFVGVEKDFTLEKSMNLGDFPLTK